MSIKKFLDATIGSTPDDKFLAWPPDVFGTCAKLLLKTGLYTFVSDHWTPKGPVHRTEPWKDWIRVVGYAWWLYATGYCHDNSTKGRKFGIPPPYEVQRWWKMVRRCGNCHVRDLRHHIPKKRARELAHALLQLCAAADEACDSICLHLQSPHAQLLKKSGINPSSVRHLLEHDFSRLASRAFQGTGANALKHREGNLCWQIADDDIGVFPRYHTPTVGLTVRSLTHHLSFVDSAEVYPSWAQVHLATQFSTYFNALLI